MRLSDAIALGRTLEPICMYSYATCALGVGMAALGIPIEERDAEELMRRWPWLREKATSSPFPQYGSYRQTWYQEISYGAILTKSRDNATLDQLIDWVRSIEPAETQEAPQSQSAEESEYADVL